MHTGRTVHRIPGLVNPFAVYRAAAGGQAIELQTLASYLGSSAHLAAMVRALERQPELPTGLVPAGGHQKWEPLWQYTAKLPTVALEVGRALVADLLDTVAAVELPVYWCGLVEGHRFVSSRIDWVTQQQQGGAYHVWELKTRWGGAAHDPPLSDIRQAVLYCYMLEMQTGGRVDKFSLRYAHVASERVTVVTHTFRFDGKALVGFFHEALGRTTAYNAKWVGAWLERRGYGRGEAGPRVP